MIRLFILLLLLVPAWAGTGSLSIYDESSSKLLVRGANASVLIFPFDENDAQVVIESEGAACVIDSVPMEWAVNMKSYVNLTNWNATCKSSGVAADGRYHALYWGMSRPEAQR